jgi:hypothetical protein
MKALNALEGVAVEMSKTTEVKFSHKCIPYPTRNQTDRRDWDTYVSNLKNTYVECYEPQKIISDAKQLMGDEDFMFEWTEKPTMKQVEDLIARIDKALAGMGVLYTMKTE